MRGQKVRRRVKDRREGRVEREKKEREREQTEEPELAGETRRRAKGERDRKMGWKSR